MLTFSNFLNSEICLKILAHNNLIGRIIGKSGNTIKRIMQETDTKITVSSINDMNSFNLERIITVKGTIENMAKAESQISAKLRQSYENDLQVSIPFVFVQCISWNVIIIESVQKSPVLWNSKLLSVVVGAGTAKHNVPGIAPYGNDVDWAWLLRRSAIVPTADLCAAGRPGRRATGRWRLAGTSPAP